MLSVSGVTPHRSTEANTDMKLTAKTVSAARFKGKSEKIYDGHGLYLHVTKTSKVWRYTYRMDGKQREFTIGAVDVVPLAKARKLHLDARALVLDGIDPVSERRKEREATKQARANAEKAGTSFGAVANQWLDVKAKEWAASNYSKVEGRVNGLPAWFTDKPVLQITADDVVSVLSGKVSEGKLHTAHKTNDYIRQIFDRAAAAKLVRINPAKDPLVKELIGKRPTGRNFAFITSERVLADVLVSIDHYLGNSEVAAALKVLPLVFTRPGELRGMRWSELDLIGKQWNIPEERMKERKSHVVPLSRQVLDILEQQRDRVPSDCELVFPGRHSKKQPISDMTLNIALKRLGYSSDVIVPHGFRHTASTFLNDRRVTDSDGGILTFRSDAIERQLSHVQGSVRDVYNKAKYIDERTSMMQAWADFLDRIKETS